VLQVQVLHPTLGSAGAGTSNAILQLSAPRLPRTATASEWNTHIATHGVGELGNSFWAEMMGGGLTVNNDLVSACQLVAVFVLNVSRRGTNWQKQRTELAMALKVLGVYQEYCNFLAECCITPSDTQTTTVFAGLEESGGFMLTDFHKHIASCGLTVCQPKRGRLGCYACNYTTDITAPPRDEPVKVDSMEMGV
jgi:hypothetical protein